MKSLFPSRRGAALVVVLAILMLVAILAVGFLSRTATERRASSSYLAGAHVQSLVDMSVNLVQAQINQGTQDSTLAWASQPGIIRTFDLNGNLVKAYKLYSAASLTSTSVTTLKTEDLPEAAWASAPAVWTDLNAWVDVDGARRYPILDPRLADDATQVEGFSITPEAPITGIQEAPMPVRWLYVLENGKIAKPTGSGNVVTVPGAEDSPIVGRIAFWTDDETCKVNINTAGDGAYWDAPKSYSAQEGVLANSQPVRNEFQRYPGHPATTSLRAVFPGASSEDILSHLTPRYRWGGSRGGTVSSATAIDISMANDRLFSSVDELIFNPQRQQGLFGRDAIDQRRFFLTAHSRAPELNLFNLPRIAIWPIAHADDAVHRTELDRTIARSSSIGAPPSIYPYYFQRENASSPTDDFAIARNLTLYSYLETLTTRAIPGFGTQTFNTKYPLGERQQILTEIFDYIRSANLHDTQLDATSGGQPFTPGWTAGNDKLALPAHGQVTPARHPNNGTMGFGRFYTISEVGLHFICTGDETIPASNNPATNLTLDAATPLQAVERRIQTMLLFELFSPAVGWSLIRPDMDIAVSGMQNIKVNGNSIFPASADGTTRISARQRELMNARAWGANPGVRYPLLYKYAPGRGRISADGTTGNDGYAYPFISDFFTVSGSTMNVEVTSPVTITISSAAGGAVQTIVLPSMAAKATRVPDLPSDSNWWTFSINPAVAGVHGRLYGLAGRATGDNHYTGGRPTAKFFTPNDVVVSFVPQHGDYRLVAAKNTISATDSPFIPHPSWNASNHFATSLYEYVTNLPISGLYSAGGYLSGATYNATFTPDNPGGSFVSTGDWDSGVSYLVDGPYINKPDEGTLARDSLATGINSYPYFGEQLSTSNVESFFSPMRQMPSAGNFGSLSTGVVRNIPWQTLLFRPQPGHPGWNAPRDHLLMDLFWMPVAEPYAISEPFSTAGKINMNFEILPFTYLTRSTGLYAILKGEKIAAVRDNRAMFYRLSTNTVDIRMDIDIPSTLTQFTDRFASGDIFRSATEICDLWIVPKGESVSSMTSFWSSHRLTGDNLRERIYTTLYPRLTTKSNTYTVHMKVQSLKPSPATTDGQWDETKGTITGEYRGSATIERYIDPINPDIPDYAENPSATPPLDHFYRWRTQAQVRFAP